MGQQHNEWDQQGNAEGGIQAVGGNLRDNAERESTSGSTGI